MPTKKPRITITLTDQQHRLLSSLAELQRVSMSSIVTELIETTVPALERLEILLETASHAPSLLLRGLGEAMDHANSVVRFLDEPEIDPRQYDLLAEREAEAPGRAAARSDLSSSTKSPRPPSTNRGVRIPPKSSKSALVSPMKTKKKTMGVNK